MMKRYEYHKELIDDLFIEERLNELGAQGWLLTTSRAAVPVAAYKPRTVCILARLIINEDQQT